MGADDEWWVSPYTLDSSKFLSMIPYPLTPSFPAAFVKYLTERTDGPSTFVLVVGEAEFGVRLAQSTKESSWTFSRGSSSFSVLRLAPVPKAAAVVSTDFPPPTLKPSVSPSSPSLLSDAS
eukprot:CAMPEP_0182479644 /NCGR_PEP_ID=MMETSP1319-20130603/34521_1 /TAXON_ID=172717 /ORGANISM="Bolidomonas pacifica, Strain RCC208" /LENGTH=120 /DNA_ID=CAMNT_0024681075 /DNA_START=131 /DNA_END=489 /DNA_ORIENTATION=+